MCSHIHRSNQEVNCIFQHQYNAHYDRVKPDERKHQVSSIIYVILEIQDFNKQSLLMLINRVTIAVFSIRHLTLVGWLVDLIVSASISIGIVVVTKHDTTEGMDLLTCSPLLQTEISLMKFWGILEESCFRCVYRRHIWKVRNQTIISYYNSYDDCIGEVLRASTSLNIHLCISNSFKRYSKIANIYAIFSERKKHHV